MTEIWIERYPVNKKSGQRAAKGQRSTVLRISADAFDEPEKVVQALSKGLEPLYVIGHGQVETGFDNTSERQVLARAHERARQLHEDNLQMADRIAELELEVMTLKRDGEEDSEPSADRLLRFITPLAMMAAQKQGVELPSWLLPGLQELAEEDSD